MRTPRFCSRYLEMPAFTPVITAKLRAIAAGLPPMGDMGGMLPAAAPRSGDERVAGCAFISISRNAGA